jgi:RNA-directed DNA polymerase
MGVTLNEAKTSIKQARQESFNFLGYTFGPQRYKKDGHWYLGASPSKKAVARIKDKVGELLVPRNTGTWEEARNQLNQILRGWSAYFSYGTRAAVYDAVDNYVYERVRHFLRRRHQVSSRGTNRFSIKAVFGELGVLQLSRAKAEPRS